MRYKFVEVEVVTAPALEAVVNEQIERGWQLDAIRFVTADGERRPRMAFVSFVKDAVERMELGEIDLGELDPFEAEVDWAQATKAPPRAKGGKRRAAPTGRR